MPRIVQKITKSISSFWKTWGNFIMSATPPSILAYLAYITESIRSYIELYSLFSYGLIIFLIIIIWVFLKSSFQKKDNIENKLIVLENATKISMLSENDKDYCVVKLHIFNCSDQIIQVTPDKKSTWVMINEKSKNPLDHYYFPKLFLPYDYNNAIQTPPIEVDLSNKSKSIEVVLSIVLNYSIYIVTQINFMN